MRVSSVARSASTQQSRQHSRFSRLRLPPLVVGRKPPGLPRCNDALCMRVAATLSVSLGRDQHVSAHRVELVATERAAIGAGLAVLGATDCPPTSLVKLRHRVNSHSSAHQSPAIGANPSRTSLDLAPRSSPKRNSVRVAFGPAPEAEAATISRLDSLARTRRRRPSRTSCGRVTSSPAPAAPASLRWAAGTAPVPSPVPTTRAMRNCGDAVGRRRFRLCLDCVRHRSLGKNEPLRVSCRLFGLSLGLLA
jgi:hypothetical protein